MKRTVLIVAIVAAVGFLFFYVARIADQIGRGEKEYFEIGQDGRIVADTIHAHDRSLDVTWTSDGHGHPDIIVKDVFDTVKQDQIVAWAKTAKDEGKVHRLIVISFQHDIPHSDEPDIMLREVDF